MKDETARELVRTMSEEELPVPAWSRVTLRADLQDQFVARRRPFARLSWVELAVHAGVGVAIASVAMWMVVACLM